MRRFANTYRYHWWADVPAKKHDQVHALPKPTVHGEPSVKYRGLFINDEDPVLTTWWAKRHNASHYPLDAEFYRHVFDMMLRLKANYLWPAMWASFTPPPGNSFFMDDAHNQQLADDYGIVVSTSHHEPMQRATNEWNASETGPWDWIMNKGNVSKFMEDGIRRAGKNESYFTLGMRGPNDGPIEADNPLEVLSDVFTTERDILEKYYGTQTPANQVWTIYKEVATYYAAGLTPPDDVTLMFTDDNWGNIQRLPTGDEAGRSGGFGVYFHLEYVGLPRSYKWHNANSLVKVLKELSHAYMRGADRIWVVNVGDFKPMEVPYGFIMDLAWNTSAIDFGSIPQYLQLFAAREFGPEHSKEIASILLEHSHLAGMRKFELVSPDTYSFFNYHENERILAAWKMLASRTAAVDASLSKDRKAAFFHLVSYPVQAAYIYHAIILGRSQNQEFAIQRRNSANKIAAQILDDFDTDFDLVQEYDCLVGGKWSGIMSQAKHDSSVDDWRPPARDMLANISYVQLRQNMDPSLGNLGIYAEESLSANRQGRYCASIDHVMPTEGIFAPVLPIMNLYGPEIRTVDLFHRGDHRNTVQWSLNIPYKWLTIIPNSGILSKQQPDQRLNISIHWDAVPTDFNETVSIQVNFGHSMFDLIHLPVQNLRVPDGFHGFPETNGQASIEGPHYQRSSQGAAQFRKIPFLGTRTESGSIALRPYISARKSPAMAKNAWVEYDFYMFDESSAVNATIYINAALDTDPDMLMKYSLSLDSAPTNFTRLLSDPKSAGDVPLDWTELVSDQVITRKVAFGAVTAGKHTLKWRVNSPEVYLEKIVLDTHGGVKQSYLGPPETIMV